MAGDRPETTYKLQILTHMRETVMQTQVTPDVLIGKREPGFLRGKEPMFVSGEETGSFGPVEDLFCLLQFLVVRLQFRLHFKVLYLLQVKEPRSRSLYVYTCRFIFAERFPGAQGVLSVGDVECETAQICLQFASGYTIRKLICCLLKYAVETVF